MIRKAIVFTVVAGALLASSGNAEARYWYRHGGGWGWGWGGGAAVGLLGGALIGSAIANQPRYYDYYDDGPVYYGPPPPYPTHCYFRRERIANQYDSGSHLERVRICN